MEEPKKLPEVRVVLQRLQPDEHAVVLEYPANLGKRTKLGGTPDWIQSDETPSCSSCHQPMSFVSQIDSIDFIDEYIPDVTRYGTEAYMFGDVGMLYLFFCFACGETKSMHQSY